MDGESSGPSPDGGAATIDDARIVRAIRILEDSHFTPPSLSELAQEVGLSPDYFLALFREATGSTPIDYLRANWLDQAAFRLGTTSDSVALVFSDFGYLSQAAFSRAFKRRHGVSPKAYQRAARAAAEAAPDIPIRLNRLPSRRCWTRRYLGPFSERELCWADFLQRVPAALGEAGDFIGLNHDDPRVRPPAEQRYDCCLASGRDLTADEEDALRAAGLQPFLTTAGLYACCAFEGSPSAVGRAYRDLIAGWLPRQDRYAIAGEPIMEAFRTGRAAMQGDKAQLDLCIKVALAGSPIDWTAGRDQRIAAGAPDVTGRGRGRSGRGRK